MILGLGQEIHKMVLEHLIVPETKEILKHTHTHARTHAHTHAHTHTHTHTHNERGMSKGYRANTKSSQ